MPACRNCGKPFTASRTGRTVNCPNCRSSAGRKASKPKVDPDNDPNAPCPGCKGERTETMQYATGGKVTQPCSYCKGTGTRRGFRAVQVGQDPRSV